VNISFFDFVETGQLPAIMEIPGPSNKRLRRPPSSAIKKSIYLRLKNTIEKSLNRPRRPT